MALFCKLSPRKKHEKNSDVIVTLESTTSLTHGIINKEPLNLNSHQK